MSSYFKREENLKENIRSLYSLILIQSTNALKANINELSTFQSMDKANNAIALLQAINEIAFKFKVHKNVHVEL